MKYTFKYKFPMMERKLYSEHFKFYVAYLEPVIVETCFKNTLYAGVKLFLPWNILGKYPTQVVCEEEFRQEIPIVHLVGKMLPLHCWKIPSLT